MKLWQWFLELYANGRISHKSYIEGLTRVQFDLESDLAKVKELIAEVKL